MNCQEWKESTSKTHGHHTGKMVNTKERDERYTKPGKIDFCPKPKARVCFPKHLIESVLTCLDNLIAPCFTWGVMWCLANLISYKRFCDCKESEDD